MLIAIVCESGERVMQQFSNYNDELNQCQWYLLSNNMQLMLLIFMNEVQQPIHIRGYGNIVCTRDSFKEVNIFDRTKINRQIFN